MADFDPTNHASMLSSHEERIQRLESVTSELASSFSEQNATMKAFTVQMHMMSDAVTEKLEDVSHRLSDKIGSMRDITKEIAEETKANAERLAQVEAVVKVEEKAEKYREKKFDFWLKCLYFSLTALGGGLAPYALELLKKLVQ